MPEIGLLIDVSEQRDEPAQPKALYASTTFERMRAHASDRHDEWWILSAEHGLLGPEGPPIEPYEPSVAGLTDEQRSDWVDRVVGDLERIGLCSEHAELVVHAAGEVPEPLLSRLRETDAAVRAPTADLDAEPKRTWYDERRD